MAQEVVKMKQGMSYSRKEKTIILNVFKYFGKTWPEKCITELVRRTAKATGCSEKSVFQFRKEEASEEGFKEPSKTKIRNNINVNSRFIKYDNSVRESIRNIIYDLKFQNIVPSLSKILKSVNCNDTLPNLSVMTLRRLLDEMGFYYEKDANGNKTILVERGLTKKDKINTKKKNTAKPVEQNDRNIANMPNLPPANTKNPAPIVAQTIPQSLPQNHIYGPNQMPHQPPGHMGNPEQRMMPMPVPQHETHMMDSIHLQHNMMINHRIPQHHFPPPPPHHIHHPTQHIGFLPHHPSSHHHNMVIQQ